MQLTDNNYYGKEANTEYMSVSLYKEFMGTYGYVGCEAQAMAKLRGEYKEEPSKAMMIGSYVDRYFEGTLDRFREEHPEIFKKDGDLKAEYILAEKVIQRIESSEVMMNSLSGQKQVIMTGEIAGVPWKIKMDSYIPDVAIVDLKVIKSFNESTWVRGLGYLNYAHYWGYDIQGAVYQEIVRQNTGKVLPFYLACATKEEGIDIDLFQVDPPYLKEALGVVERNMPDVIEAWKGKREPRRCNQCTYCRMTKVLTGPRWISKLDEAWQDA